MRPIKKRNNSKKYNNSKDDLRNKIGLYWLYYEMYISNQPDIEHVIPKTKNEILVTDCNNLLLVCKTCNRLKSNTNDNRKDYLFPDTHNTTYAYKYTQTKLDDRKVARLIKWNEAIESLNNFNPEQSVCI